jgi:hypothetical protein
MFVLTFIGLLLSSEFLSFQLALMHFSNASRVPKVTSQLAVVSCVYLALKIKKITSVLPMRLLLLPPLFPGRPND